jgi:hypothetical protein
LNVRLMLGDRAVLRKDHRVVGVSKSRRNGTPVKTFPGYAVGEDVLDTESGMRIEGDLFLFCTGGGQGTGMFPADQMFWTGLEYPY